MDKPLWDYHKATGLAAIPFTSQANGLFDKLEKGRLDSTIPSQFVHYPIPPNRARLEKIRAISAEAGWSTTQVVLGYLLSQPFATIPIIGPKNISQLEDSMRAAGVRLSPDQIAAIEAQV
jgi:aryl-alcohol dehydrogenase-like predicted oxidoreductase